MKKGVKRLGIAMMVIAFLAVSSVAFAAAVQQPGTIIKPEYSTFSLFPQIEGFDYPPVHFYVWGTGGIFSNPISMVASWILMLGAVLLRLGIMLLDLGMHPTFINTPIEKITESMQKHGWPFVKLLMPLVMLGSFFLFGRDYMKGAVGTTVRRFMAMGLTMVIIGVSFAMPATTVVKGLTAVSEFGNWIATQVVLVFGDEEDPESTNASTRDSANRFLYEESWELLVYQPYAKGQLADANVKLSNEEIVKVNEIIAPYQAMAGQRWGDVMLWFSSSSDEREDLLDYYADRYEANYDFADDGFWRCLIAIFQLIVALFALLFFALIGGILVCLGVYFLGLLVTSIIILPMSLIPSQNVAILKFLTKIAGVFMAIIFVNLYVAVVFIVSRLITANDGSSTASFLGSMFLLALVFIAATVMFFVIILKMQSVGALKPMNDVMTPIARRGQQIARRARNSRKRKKHSDGYDDDDDEDDGADEEEENDSSSRDSRSRQSKTRSRSSGRGDRADPAETSNAVRRAPDASVNHADTSAAQPIAEDSRPKRTDQPVRPLQQSGGAEGDRPDNSSRDRVGAVAESAGGTAEQGRIRSEELADRNASPKRNTDRMTDSREASGSDQSAGTVTPAGSVDQDANSAGDAVRRISASLKDVDQDAKSAGDSIQKLSTSLRDVDQDVKPAGDAVRILSTALKDAGTGGNGVNVDSISDATKDHLSKMMKLESAAQEQAPSAAAKDQAPAEEVRSNDKSPSATSGERLVASGAEDSAKGKVQAPDRSNNPSDGSQSPVSPVGAREGHEHTQASVDPPKRQETTQEPVAQSGASGSNPVRKDSPKTPATTKDKNAAEGAEGNKPPGATRRKKSEKQPQSDNESGASENDEEGNKQNSDKT